MSHFGAHLGQEVPTYIEKKIPYIHLFEPQSDIFNQLVKKFKNYNNCFFYNFGLGNNETLVKLYLEKTRKESSSILKPANHLILHPEIIFEGTEEIQIKKYDSLKIKEVNFLNIDIQGYELEALKGCNDSLINIDYIYTEINREEVYENCANLNELDLFLDSHGFIRVETVWWENFAWGDAFYIKKHYLKKNTLYFKKFINSFLSFKFIHNLRKIKNLYITKYLRKFKVLYLKKLLREFKKLKYYLTNYKKYKHYIKKISQKILDVFKN